MFNWWFQGPNLAGKDFFRADLNCAKLRNANLIGADLRGANLEFADLRGADLRLANLREADLRGANLRGANLRGAKLGWADFRGAKLHKTLFDEYPFGEFVYKIIGAYRAPPEHWVIEPGSLLTEKVDTDRRKICCRGIHFATLEWCQRAFLYPDIWKCKVEGQMVVPYATDGKGRTDKLRLLERVRYEMV